MLNAFQINVAFEQPPRCSRAGPLGGAWVGGTCFSCRPRAGPSALPAWTCKSSSLKGSKALELGWQPGLNEPTKEEWFSEVRAMGDEADGDFL